MADTAQSERLQPSLLDRLTDNEPAKKEESRAQRVLSMKKLREGVVRDLLWLLNTTKLDVTQEISKYPEVAKSVVNFGVPDLVGVTASSVDARDLEQQIREAIWNYEPRLKRNSVHVRAAVADGRQAQNTLVFEIEGELWAEPMPIRLFLKTQLDLEDGSVTTVDGTQSESR